MVGGVANNYVVAFAGAAWLAGALCLPARACDLSQPETGTVAAVIDGETLQFTDGRTIRLIGAKAPMPPLGWRGEDPWPLVDEAKDALERLASGREIELRFGERRIDCHGHALAQVFVVDGGTRLWLQEEMIAKGLARVFPCPTAGPVLPSLWRGRGRRGPSGAACGVRRPTASPAPLT